MWDYDGGWMDGWMDGAMIPLDGFVLCAWAGSLNDRGECGGEMLEIARRLCMCVIEWSNNT
jgi:hypothetical protein